MLRETQTWGSTMNDDDNISEWAASLTPEGAPGVMSQKMREFLGDAGYEKAMALNDASANLHIQRQTLINNLLGIAVLWGAAFGIVGLITSVALAIRKIFS